MVNTTNSTSVNGIEVTQSEGHPYHKLKANGPDLGGEFLNIKKYIRAQHDPVRAFERVQVTPTIHRTYQYDGVNLAYLPLSAGKVLFPPAANSSDDDLDEWGAMAVSQTEPTNGPAEAATAVGELLKDGLPFLPMSQTIERRLSAARSAGSEYLNAVFGWLPLVSDIRSLAGAMKDTDRILAQYERDAGRVVRRRFGPLTEQSSEEVVVSNSATPFGLNGFFVVTPGKLMRKRTTLKRRWFSGAYTYYLPDDYDSRSSVKRLALMADLIGASPTPETLWNLTPWSWAVDWFSNSGDVIHNLDAFSKNGLVMRYGYVMEHTITTDTYTMIGGSYKGGAGHPAPVTLVTETKRRRRANPFGFGVSWNGLSAFQLSVAAALGISR